MEFAGSWRAAALAGGLILAGASLSGCGGNADALGFGKVTPDEFRVVAKAPLVLPPDYALRPPKPGEPRPQELQPESAARQAILGKQAAVQRSAGEQLFVARAGGDKADPLARFVVDDENGEIAHKDKSFADMVMFWKAKDASAATDAAAAGKGEPAPIDAAAEAEKIKAATGAKTVIIRRQPEQFGIKLPGL
jgi:Protein of unknown function (DUF3035)